MTEFIFNIEQIFDVSNGVLKQNAATKYYIAPYQRGYKWGSEKEFDAVCLLLNDVYQAFKRASESQYYLQYMTVKRQAQVDGITTEPVLEIIDGQQRLTTLSLFFLALNNYSYRFSDITRDALIYARYDRKENPLQHALDVVKNNPINTSYPRQDINPGYDLDKDQCDTQDLFYMVRAIRYILLFLNGQTKEQLRPDELDDFVKFLQTNVMLIVNLENAFIEEEVIFANLNDNKVPLTDAYLIKGLLLTKAVEREDKQKRSYSYKYIIDQRRIMGRMWDEIQSWINIPAIKHFFFSATSLEDGMNMFLRLLLKFIDKESLNDSETKDLALYNHYHTIITDEKEAQGALEGMKSLYRFLQTCYDDVELFNLIGFNRFSKSSEKFEISTLFSQGYLSTLRRLKDAALKRIPDLGQYVNDYLDKKSPHGTNDNISSKDLMEAIPYKKLGYNTKQDLNNLLLALSVFAPGIRVRFDFYNFTQNRWTFEHISPQHPNNEEMREFDEYESSIADNENYLHSAGNMAFLSDKVNPSVGNDPFCDKRRAIQLKANEGHFIPRHTLDVFSKLLEETDVSMSPDLTLWKEIDIENHLRWMWIRINKIREELKQ